MSVRFFVEYKGKRQAVTVNPMSPMSAVIQEACAQCKPPLDHNNCQLQYQKKMVDLSTPVRFANLPKDAKLEVIPGQQQPLEPSDSPAAGESQAIQSQEQRMLNQNMLAAASPLQAQMSMHAEPQQHGPSTSEPRSAPRQPSQPIIEACHPQEQAQQPVAPGGAVPAGVDRHVYVFKREAIAAQEGNTRSDVDLPADFYNFTADDYQAVMSGWAKQRQSAAGPLKTQKLREEDERRRVQQFGPVPVRVHLPDGVMLQADFKAIETIGALHRLVQQCAASGLPKWYLYVTPPKQVLKDLDLSFYKAGLVPAANVVVGMDGQLQGPFLKQHVAALEGPAPVRQPGVSQVDRVPTTDGAGQKAGGTDFMPSKAATAGTGKKTPKWMKLGK